MLLMIIFVIVIILGIFLWILGEKIETRGDLDITISVSGILLTLCVGAAIVFLVPYSIVINSKSVYNENYIEWESRYDGLVARLDNWENGDVSDATLMTDIQNFNLDLLDNQYWAKNKWTNWYNEQACLKFNTIEIPEYLKEKIE